MQSRAASIDDLRSIGWSLWDPIGLSGISNDWRGEPYEDEYDRYLIIALEMVINGSPTGEIVDNLFQIQSQYMGMEPKVITPNICADLSAVVKAIENLVSL